MKINGKSIKINGSKIEINVNGVHLHPIGTRTSYENIWNDGGLNYSHDCAFGRMIEVPSYGKADGHCIGVKLTRLAPSSL